MKLLTVLLATLTLTGCFWQTVDSAEIHQAQMFCDKHDSEVSGIRANWTSTVDVYCKNDKTERLFSRSFHLFMSGYTGEAVLADEK